MRFASDNAGPAHPAVIEALLRANAGHAHGYGGDDGAGRPASHDDVVVLGDQVLRHGLVEHAVLLLLSAGH